METLSSLKRKKIEQDCHSSMPHFSSKWQCRQSQICSKYIYNIQSYELLRYQNELEVLLVNDLRHTNHYVLPMVLHTNTILCDTLSNIWRFLYTYLHSSILPFLFAFISTQLLRNHIPALLPSSLLKLYREWFMNVEMSTF